MVEAIYRLLAVVLAALGLASAGNALGQAKFPSKAPRFIAMGTGFPENTARVMGHEMFELTGQRVVVEAKPGANGILAAEYVAKAAPDGYTILIGTNSTHAANQSLYKKLSYDYVKDFIPVSGIAQGMVLAVVVSVGMGFVFGTWTVEVCTRTRCLRTKRHYGVLNPTSIFCGEDAKVIRERLHYVPPVDVLHECIHIRCRFVTVVDVIRVLVHIERE